MRTLLTLYLAASLTQTPVVGTESPHRHGPHGLEGWIVNETSPEYGPLPHTLVIAKDGRILYRITGTWIISGWMFQQDGAQIAYSTGPLHFGDDVCVLMDTKTGREIARRFDCSNTKDVPNIPAWVEDLLRNGR